MRRFIIASHAHLATGLVESLSLLVGERDDLVALPLFVDGNTDVEALTRAAVANVPADDDLVICTDILGGSVNNEFTKIVATRPNTYLMANMNLPSVIALVFASPETPTEEVVRGVVTSPENRLVFVNDVLAAETEDEEEF